MRALRNAVVLFLLGMATGALAQREPKLVITPPEASLQPGQGQRFEAALFDAAGQHIRIISLRWRVEPDSLGKITDDGFFIAGRNAGAGAVIAEAKAEGWNTLFVGRAQVKIGRQDPLRVRVVVRPEIAVVPPGEQQQFKAFAFGPGGEPLAISRVRWEVRPPELGKIDDHGVFTAGRETRQGEVVAFVETSAGVFQGAARVIVSVRPSSAITGKVVAEDGTTPLTGMVCAERVADGPWRGEAPIAEDGSYIIGNLMPGIYVLKAQVRGFLPEFYDNVDQFVEAKPVQLAAHDTASGIDFSLRRGAGIAGLITVEDGGTPLAGAHVFASRVVRPDLRHHAVSNDDGTYLIENLPAGSYAVFAEAPGYRGEFYDNAGSLLEAKLIAVMPPATVSGIDLALATASAIRGRVVDAISGAALAKAQVTIQPARGPQPGLVVRTVLTDEEGNYLAGVPPGSYLVMAQARGYHPEFYDGVRERSQATPVTVEEGKHTAGIDFKLDPLSRISGKVTAQATGNPLSGALVLAFRERHATNPAGDPGHLNGPYAARTDSNGVYLLEGLPAGKYFVMAEAHGYLNEFWQEAPALEQATAVEVPESGEITGIDFTLEQGGAISGRVVASADAMPIPGATVHVWLLGSNWTTHSQTDRQGNYRVAGLRSGQYVVYAEAKGFKPQFYDGVETRDNAKPVSVTAPNETSGIDFKLEKLGNLRGAISGTVTAEADGSPIAHAIVLAIPTTPGAPGFAWTDALGQYTVPGLKPGKYIVLAWARHFLLEFYDNVRHWRQATPVAVTEGAETTGINFSLAAGRSGPYRIAGRVTRGNSSVGEGYAAVFALANGVPVASAVAEANGTFTVEDVPAGDYKLMSSGPGGTAYFGGPDEQHAANITLGNGASVSNVTINLPATPTHVEEAASVPVTFALQQNYPNPFNPETMIQYELPQRVEVTLKIFNALGQEVRTLVQKVQEPGVYRVTWDGRDNRGVTLGAGIYLVQMQAGDFKLTRKMALVK
ncbi:MAG: carboxypeptidase regulatory-like domain-containing protein [candidate division KSB1 bacterium]|nr:carboxypeptidase regulatory-like domain-containing protein [candidate division KSB1 bacterium]MDZ7273742.1 carboxypeptidase regulatory-like domain-containing protein [candidate division KSB1 bacterium]MDZ7285898.1 carboxypeptidase regulatory-like domain-containing protein [candidate division KSB1 bacterium]MDZ7298930.1 carboxypeptidase regulatory-like domain-containing protein [candidate division KSB1 bacterium]MDZ7307605.1 carboxypeptidase regulatory-like domain-containing protein [candidat